MGINVAELNEAIAAAIPDREAIVFGDRRFTYRDLNNRARRLANLFLENDIGIQKERDQLRNWESGQDHVALYMYNGNEYPESILGCLKARAVPININYRYVEEELIHVMRDARVKAIIFHGCFADKVKAILPELPDVKLLIQVDEGSNASIIPQAVEYETALAASSDEKPNTNPSPDDIYMIYTGGTTGMPKGVLWRQADFLTSMLSMKDADGTPITDIETIVDKAVNSPTSSSLAAPPYMHGTGQLVSFIAWHNGNTVVLQDNVQHMDPAELLAVAEREKVRTLTVVGDAFARPIAEELERNSFNLENLKLMVSSGAIFSQDIKDRILKHVPGLSIFDAFGSTETGPHGVNVSKANDGSQTGKFKFAAGGVALDATKTRMLTPQDTENGWFAVMNDIPLGYLNDEAKTKETFPVVDGIRYSVPGDRVKLDEDGSMVFLGRDSVTINSGGEKIFAEEVEQALKNNPNVQDVVVSSRPNERFGNEVVAIIQSKQGHKDISSELEKTAEEHIARYKLPRKYIFVDKVSRGQNGKVDYQWAKSVAENSLKETADAS